MSSLRIVFGLLALAGCAGRSSLSSTVVSPAEYGALAPFTEAELREPVVVRNVRSSPEASFQVIRIKGALAPRSHTRSDAVLMVMSGRVQARLGKDDFSLTAGNVLELPHGVVYELVNRDASASLVYVVYTPQLAADDVKVAPSADRDSAWKWNLWTN